MRDLPRKRLVPWLRFGSVLVAGVRRAAGVYRHGVWAGDGEWRFRQPGAGLAECAVVVDRTGAVPAGAGGGGCAAVGTGVGGEPDFAHVPQRREAVVRFVAVG